MCPRRCWEEDASGASAGNAEAEAEEEGKAEGKGEGKVARERDGEGREAWEEACRWKAGDVEGRRRMSRRERTAPPLWTKAIAGRGCC